jgi:hypothetical protein
MLTRAAQYAAGYAAFHMEFAGRRAYPVSQAVVQLRHELRVTANKLRTYLALYDGIAAWDSTGGKGRSMHDALVLAARAVPHPECRRLLRRAMTIALTLDDLARFTTRRTPPWDGGENYLRACPNVDQLLWLAGDTLSPTPV